MEMENKSKSNNFWFFNQFKFEMWIFRWEIKLALKLGLTLNVDSIFDAKNIVKIKNMENLGNEGIK